MPAHKCQQDQQRNASFHLRLQNEGSLEDEDQTEFGSLEVLRLGYYTTGVSHAGHAGSNTSYSTFPQYRHGIISTMNETRCVGQMSCTG